MKRDEMTIRELYDTGKTIAGTYLEAYTYPWEVLPHIGYIVRELGSGLSEDEYQRLGEDVWIHKTVTVPPTATVKGPAIFCRNAEIRPGAFVRGNVLVGEGAASLTSNVKSDKTLVKVHGEDGDIETGLKKFGAAIGDFVEVGCGCVLNPGSVVGAHSSIYPLSSVRGCVNRNSIFKREGVIVEKEAR